MTDCNELQGCLIFVILKWTLSFIYLFLEEETHKREEGHSKEGKTLQKKIERDSDA